MENVTFTIQNTGISYDLKLGYSLLNNFLFHQIVSPAKCGGKAMCGLCRVQIVNGLRYCTRPNDEEKTRLSEQQLAQGWRLACQTQCIKSIELLLPAQSEVN